MLQALAQLLNFLDHYSNLLLAALTAMYVVLTWRSLTALRRASLGDRETRHLEDMKRTIVRPLTGWLDEEAVSKLKGISPLIQVRTVAVFKTSADLGEQAYEYPRKLEHTISDPRGISWDLLNHAKEFHFAQQLETFSQFRKAVQELAVDCASFARRCADEIAASTDIPRGLVVDNLPQVADSDSLVEVCLRDFMLGRPNPEINMRFGEYGAFEVLDNFTPRLLGKGTQVATEDWVRSGVKHVRERWNASGLVGGIEHILVLAKQVRPAIDLLEFTYLLPGDCDYVGGVRHNSLKRLWHCASAQSVNH
jgi:hypothetical protein